MRGLGQQLLGLDLGELRERAPARLVAPDLLRGRGQGVEAVDLGVLVGGLVAVDDDLVAGLPARHAGADLPDDARGVRAADVVVVLGVVAEDRDRLAERRPHVVEVHAGGHDADDDLEGAGLGHLDLLDLEGVDGLALALLADDPCGHRRRQLAGLDVRDLRNTPSRFRSQSVALRAFSGGREPYRPRKPERSSSTATRIGRTPQAPTPRTRNAHGRVDCCTNQPKFCPKKPVTKVSGRKTWR